MGNMFLRCDSAHPPDGYCAICVGVPTKHASLDINMNLRGNVMWRSWHSQRRKFEHCPPLKRFIAGFKKCMIFVKMCKRLLRRDGAHPPGAHCVICVDVPAKRASFNNDRTKCSDSAMWRSWHSQRRNFEHCPPLNRFIAGFKKCMTLIEMWNLLLRRGSARPSGGYCAICMGVPAKRASFDIWFNHVQYSDYATRRSGHSQRHDFEHCRPLKRFIMGFNKCMTFVKK